MTSSAQDRDVVTPRDAPERRPELERAHFAELAGGIATFEIDLLSKDWTWTPQMAALFGFAAEAAKPSAAELERAIFVDDVPKLRAAIDAAVRTGSLNAEFRVRRRTGVCWLAAKGGTRADETGRARWLCGVYRDITDRKELEARLLALNETLEGRVQEVREEARTLEILNRTGAALAAELSLERLVQTVIDAGVALTGARLGAFFYNVIDERGESYTLHSLSGIGREAFAGFPMPRNTAVFAPTFRGEGPVRSDDILADPRYGQAPPHHGMPEGHPPVRSYLALPVNSRSGETIGGLFFGHPDPGVFTEREERIGVGLAGQAAIAVDNARLYEASQREIAARRQAERELKQMNESLEDRVAEEVAERQKAEDSLRQVQKMEAIGQLTGGIAHDFNNLLTVITGNVEYMQRQLSREHELQRSVAAALRGSSRAAMLTQRLLAFSRQQPLVPRVIGLNDLIAGLSDLLRRTLGETIAVETVREAGLWNIFADANQIENAIINLALNARDAMLDGGKLTIETANWHLDESYTSLHGDVRPGQYAGLFVTDTGIGMAEDVVAKAFEPFFTTKGVGQGTGLGLSQVYGFVKQSGGHVKIYSEVGHGTAIKLYFPRYSAGVALAESVPEPGFAPRANADEAILIVEDDPDVRSFTTKLVQDLGYRVVSAEDGAAALRSLDAHADIRLLFTDVGLPRGMNGRQLANEAMRRRPRLKVLFTTGYARNAIVHHGRLDPGVEVVFKPFSRNELATKLRRLLDAVD